mgnify:CR=1 FL=1|tara:strand:+ start:374 stop:1486 length:1113 start_codon:yes stop_codon:yes gene_type:complete
MNSLKKEYTRTVQNIWQAFYDHDEKRIDLIKKEIILRLNKLCEYHNQFCHQSEKYVDDDEEYEKRKELAKRLIDDYNLPEKLYRSEEEEIIPKSRIRLYEKYIKNNYCKGIPAKDGEYDLDARFDEVPIHYMERFDDLDLAYIFFGVPLNSAWDLPKFCRKNMFYNEMSWYQILYHIEDRTNWKNGFHEFNWENGNKQWAGSFVNGLQHGLHTIWSPGGTRATIIDWSHGCSTGIEYYYDEETSEIVRVDITKDGEPLMSSKHSFDIRRIKAQKKPLSLFERPIIYEENNMLRHPYIKTKKRKHGKFKKGSGNLYFEGEYNNNIPVGIWREYLDNKLIYELAYKDGEIDLENSIFRYKRTGTPIPWNKLK